MSKADQIRAQAIDKCLQQPDRLWAWEDLARACGTAARKTRPEARDPSRRSILQTIQRMRQGDLGYQAPIVVQHNKYYAYADPRFRAYEPPWSQQHVQQLLEALQLLRHYPQWPLIAELEALSLQLAQEAPTVATKDERPLILFDQLQDGPGHQWLRTLYDHIRNRERILMHYQPFNEEEMMEKIVSPYLLKAYNKRWFLLGYDHPEGRVHTFGLDRIHAIRPHLPHTYFSHSSFDARLWFSKLYGVSMPYDAKPEEIQIATAPVRAKYWLHKPIHPSQTVLSRSEDRVVFRFHLIINFEWQQLLLSFGSEIQVLAPQHLADTLRDRHRRAYEQYR